MSALSPDARERLYGVCGGDLDSAWVTTLDEVSLGDLRALLADSDALAAAEARIIHLTQRDELLVHERDEARFLMECANTPLMRDVQAERDALRAQVATLREALGECEEWFDQRADADCVGDPPRYHGNAAMTMLGVVRRALASTAPEREGADGNAR